MPQATCTTYTLRRFEEIYALSKHLAGFFPEPHQVQSAIYELLFNAQEHGNLGLGFEYKSQLLRENRWAEEIARRQDDPANREKTVGVEVKDGSITIADHGNGFDWKKYIRAPLLPQRLNGRGLLIAQTCQKIPLRFNDAGNRVTLG
jgi:hypothetical protein